LGDLPESRRPSDKWGGFPQNLARRARVLKNIGQEAAGAACKKINRGIWAEVPA
jgi:hypothetical protein